MQEMEFFTERNDYNIQIHKNLPFDDKIHEGDYTTPLESEYELNTPLRADFEDTV